MTLIETQYLPPIATFSEAIKSGTLMIEAHENYQKRSFRNRCDLAAANGIISLTVPLESGKNRQLNVRDVRISYAERWQAQHWQTIISAYGKSPFFEHYVDGFAPLYEKKYDFLFDFNYALTEKIIKYLKLDIKIILSSSYVNETLDSIVDIRNTIRSREQLLSQATNKKYPQVFEDRFGFLPQLSILDMLFCVGNQSENYL